MSQLKVFLCPSCQAVIQSDQGAEEGLACGECGHEFHQKTSMPVPAGISNTSKSSGSVVRNVAGRKSSFAVDAGAQEIPSHEAPLVLNSEARPAENTGEMPPGEDELIMPDGSRRVRRRKKKLKKEKHKGLFVFLVAWMAVISGVYFLFKSGKDDSDRDEVLASNDDSIEAARDSMFLGQHWPITVQYFKAFLGQYESDKRLQFIDQSSRLSAQFNRFYRAAGVPKPEGRIFPIARNVIELKPEPNPVLGIETLWQDEGGSQLGSVHVHDGENQNSWKLDWEAFAPHSTTPWTLFRSQLGRSEGTFRLYVRKMKSRNESDKIYLRFLGPSVFGNTEKKGVSSGESPEVEVMSRSDLGKKIIQLWEDFENEKHPLGSILPMIDPKGYMRVTAKLAWGTDEKERPKLELVDIVGVSWYGQRIVDSLEEVEAEMEAEAQSNEEAAGRDENVSELDKR